MSVHYLSSISPILHGNGMGFSTVSPKLQLHNGLSFLVHRYSAYVGCIGRIPGAHLRKPHKFVRDLLATKAVKTDEPEVFSFGEEESGYVFDWGDVEDEGSPWEGAIIYRRNSSIPHVEYCTTLERLGLNKLSSEVSRSRASIMGLRVTKAVKEYVDGTPVLISVDITRKKRKLRLDGIIRTVIALSCNRCGEPAAESVYSNFSLLLTEQPVEEPDVINMGTIYGEDKVKNTVGTTDVDDEDDALIDIEDRLYFPPEDKEIDISKQIRDLVHLEITINSICDPKCKGLCLQCGTNLNSSVCSCSKQDIDGVSYGPLGELKKQMQQK